MAPDLMFLQFLKYFHNYLFAFFLTHLNDYKQWFTRSWCALVNRARFESGMYFSLGHSAKK